MVVLCEIPSMSLISNRLKESTGFRFPHDILLDAFDVEPLKARKGRAALTFLYKLVYNEVDCSLLVSQFSPRLSSR